ncbi:MAG: VanW family protein [Lachnospiraceae bacterium]|jgi:vancomycin resistance protein YoaR|nr:VanW family protein [Lachnospiraceae bacterium]
MNSKKGLWALAAAALGAAIWCACPIVVMADTLPNGIFIGNRDVGGMSLEEAEKYAREYVDMLDAQTITLTVGGTDVQTTAGEVGFSWSNPGVVRETLAPYLTGNLIEKYLRSEDLLTHPVSVPILTDIRSDGVEWFIETHCQGLMAEPQDATITRDRETQQFIITPGLPGVQVDVEATKAAILEATKDGLGLPVRAAAVAQEAQPKVTTEMLETITDVLGTFSTGFSSSGASRSTNLAVGASKINGHVLMPGETLSGYECMAPFTKDNGYMSAGAYENGVVVDSIGGGVCQIATTLYNAVLRAELEVVQRQNHSMVVSYVKPSEDAAIAGTYKDLKFKNVYDTPIYVEGYTANRRLYFTIYGKETRPSNRKISFISETLSVWDAGEPEVQIDLTMAPGATKTVQESHRGYRSRLWKSIEVDGVEQERFILHTDNYNASKAIVRSGPPIDAALPETVVEAPPQAEETQPAQSGPIGPGMGGAAGGSTGGGIPSFDTPATQAPTPETPSGQSASPVSPAGPGAGGSGSGAAVGPGA